MGTYLGDFLAFYQIYALTRHFISYSLLVVGWSPFCLQNCFHSLQIQKAAGNIPQRF